MTPRDATVRDLLKAVPSFRQLSDDELQRIGSILGERAVEPGELLVEEGETGRESFLVAEGEATVSSGGVVIARVGPGEFVGELALLTESPRCATVRAESSMRLLVLDGDALASLLDPITEALLGTLARRARADNGTASATPATSAAPATSESRTDAWTVGATVAVRSHYEGTWVDGFEVADVDLSGPAPRVQVRRRSDGAVLPVLFDPVEIRLS